MRILVITVLVKYPLIESLYLSSNSYVVETDDTGQVDPRDVSKCFMEFKTVTEVDGRKITNMIAYFVPEEQLDQILNDDGKSRFFKTFGRYGTFKSFNLFGEN